MKKNPGRKAMRESMKGHKPFRPTAGAMSSGGTLDASCVKKAGDWRENRIKQLLSVDRLSLTQSERSEVRRLTGQRDFWNYKGYDKA